jgi:hypothetical protein
VQLEAYSRWITALGEHRLGSRLLGIPPLGDTLFIYPLIPTPLPINQCGQPIGVGGIVVFIPLHPAGGVRPSIRIEVALNRLPVLKAEADYLLLVLNEVAVALFQLRAPNFQLGKCITVAIPTMDKKGFDLGG